MIKGDQQPFCSVIPGQIPPHQSGPMGKGELCNPTELWECLVKRLALIGMRHLEVELSPFGVVFGGLFESYFLLFWQAIGFSDQSPEMCNCPSPLYNLNSQFEILMPKIRNRIVLEDFATLSLIGKGTFARVVFVKKLSSGIPYAMKIINKKQVLKKKQQDYVLIEKKVLSEVDHPFIVQMVGCFQSPQRLYFVLQYCPGGDLYGLITKRHRFTQEQARFYAGQIILALQHLHQRDIVYRDLKPENVLLDKNGYLKLTDFGLSNICHGNQQACGMVGTPQYLAPEILNKLPYGKAVDYWCLGNVIYQMVAGIPAFYGSSNQQTFEKIRNHNPVFPPKTSTRLKSLLEGLLNKDPTQRLGFKSADEIKYHPWFSKTNWEGLLKKQQKSPFVPMLQEEYDISNFDSQFTECEVNSWDDKRSSDEEWDLSDFSYQNDRDEIGSVTSEESSGSGSFEMKAEEETIQIQ